MAYYDTIALEKGMYTVGGKPFGRVLEELDPSDQYQGTALEGLDAFERQLKRFGIRVSGGNSDVVDKFFSTATSSALFPEYVRRAVIAGMEDDSILRGIIAAKTMIDSLDYRSITSLKEDKELKIVTEGSAIPVTKIRTKESLVQLKKRGRMLTASYEAIRFQRLDLFSVALRQIGNAIARSQLQDAVEVLVGGDGNNNAAGSITLAGSRLSYQDLIRLWGEFDDHQMDTMLADTATVMEMLDIEEFKNPLTGLNFQGTGKLSTPIGANLYKSSAVPAKTIIGFDRQCALEMVCAGEVQVEYDKLMDHQLERAAVTSIYGFSKIFPDAVKVLSL